MTTTQFEFANLEFDERFHQVNVYSVHSLYGRGANPDDAQYVQAHPWKRETCAEGKAHMCIAFSGHDVIYFRTREEAEQIAATVKHPRRPNATGGVCRQALAGYNREGQAQWWIESGVIV